MNLDIRTGGVTDLEALGVKTEKPRYKHKGVDLTGQRFGKLVAEKKVKIAYGKYKWVCKCDCGNITLVKTYHLVHGNIKSCGCEWRKASVTHGQTYTRLYYLWCAMKRRCQCETDGKYYRYGGRGIKVCEEWQSFAPFREWALSNGYDDSLTIDRIDNNGNYEPLNCRWTTAEVQANNKSTNRYITHNVETHSLAEWSRNLGISYKLLYGRLKRGWSFEDAISIPKISTARKEAVDEQP